MQQILRPHTTARVLLGLAATACAFGVAATMSSANARADDFTEITNDVQALLVAGQADFTAAETDFSSGIGGVPNGLQALFTGEINDGVLPSDQVLLGAVEALQGQPIEAITALSVPSPVPDLAAGLGDAQAAITTGSAEFTAAAQELAGGNLSQSVIDVLTGSLFFDVGGQEVFSGAVDQLLSAI